MRRLLRRVAVLGLLVLAFLLVVMVGAAFAQTDAGGSAPAIDSPAAFLVGAGALIGIAYGGVETFKFVFDVDVSTKAGKRVLALVILVLSFAIVFLLRYSSWADTQQVGGKRLDQLSIVSLVVVAVVLTFAEVATFFVLKDATKALSNIGFNQPTPTVMPPVPGATTPTPPVDPMPDFTGDNVHVVPSDYTGPPDV